MTDLRNSLSAAFEDASKEEAPISNAPAPQEQAVEQEPALGETKQPVTPVSEASKELPKEQEKQPEVKPVEQKQGAPSSWKNETKALWGQIPPVIQSEITKRERDFQKFINDSAPARQVYGQLGQILEPHMETFNQAKVHPLAVVNDLLNQGRILWTGNAQEKAAMAAKIILDCQVSIEELDKALTGNIKAKQDPNITYMQNMLQEQLGPIKQALARQQGSVQQATQDDVELNELKEFAATHPHFEAVRNEMADLIEMAANRRQQLSLEQAYSLAVGARPELQQAMQQVNRQQQPAANISHSISGSPGVQAPAIDPSDLRAAISGAFDSLRS